MENTLPLKKYEVLGVPQKIMFKKELTKNFLSYRYVHRQCKKSLKLSIETDKNIETKLNENTKADVTIIRYS